MRHLATITLLLALTLAALPGASAAVEVTLISRTPEGLRGNSASSYPVLSADGRFVAFMSMASNLVVGDTNNYFDIFLHDREAGQTTRVSTPLSGLINAGASFNPAISADGRFVAFDSEARNLVAGDTTYDADIYIYDRQSGQLSRVLAPGGAQPDDDSRDPALSGDGRFVAFMSLASNLLPGDPDPYATIYVQDRQTGELTRVSVATGGEIGDGGSSEPAISADGRYVAFRSIASNLVPGDSNGMNDIFVHDRQTGQTTRVSVATGGEQANNNAFAPTISADGRLVAFQSTASNLVAGDSNGKSDIFVHDRQTGQTTRVSVTSTGAQADQGSFDAALTADGRLVAFQSSASNLIHANSSTDVFIHDRQTGATTRVSPEVSSGRGFTFFSERPALSADGAVVAFESNLVAREVEEDVWESDIFVSEPGAPPPSGGGTLSGRVTGPDGQPLAGITVIAYGLGSPWRQAGLAETSADGSYSIGGLAPGAFKVFFSDLRLIYRTEYYNDQTSIGAATTVQVNDGVSTPEISASLSLLPVAPLVTGRVSTGRNPSTGLVSISVPRGLTQPFTYTRSVSCPGGGQPRNVTLLVGAKSIAMADVGGGRFQATVSRADLVEGPAQPLAVRYTCPEQPQPTTEDDGSIQLYDPSGVITDAASGQPVPGATVRLYRVPGALPDSGATASGDCRTVASRPATASGAFGAWSGVPAASLDLGALVNPDLGVLNGTQEISPTVNPLVTGDDGRYGWDVVQGCWYIAVSAPGYATLVSPVVGVPPAVTDLDLRLTSSRKVYLPSVLR